MHYWQTALVEFEGVHCRWTMSEHFVELLIEDEIGQVFTLKGFVRNGSFR